MIKDYDYIIKIMGIFNKEFENFDIKPFIITNYSLITLQEKSKIKVETLKEKIKNGENIPFIDIKSILKDKDFYFFYSDKEMTETNNFFKLYYEDKIKFEEKYGVLMYWITSSYVNNDINNDLITINPFFIKKLSEENSYQEVLIKILNENKWSYEELTFFQQNLIDPVSMSKILFEKNYIEFLEFYKKNLDKKEVKNAYYQKKSKKTMLMREFFEFSAEEFILSINDLNSSISFSVVKDELKNLELLKETIFMNTSLKEYFKVKNPKKKKAQNKTFEILIDNREYKSFVFKTVLAGTNFRPFKEMITKFNNILTNATNFKIQLELYSKYDSEQGVRKDCFAFKVDKRVYLNEDDFGVMLKDLMLELFMLDTKSCVNQIENYTETVPMVKKILDYTRKSLIENENKAINSKKNKI